MRGREPAFVGSSFGVDVVVSIRPEHASRLYRGEKIFELRKIAPRFVPRRMFLYETNGLSGFQGMSSSNECFGGSQ